MIVRRLQQAEGYPPGGELIRQWSQPRIRAAIDSTTTSIRQALRAGEIDQAITLISRKIGLRICAGEINPRLKQPPP